MPGTLKARVGGAWVPVLGGTGNEVTISPDTPVDPDTELWYDTDDVAPYWLPGGSVGQVPMKQSSADGDIQWSDTPYNALPKGLIAWKNGTNSGTATSTTPITIYSIAATLTAGRAYSIEFEARALSPNANNYRFQGAAAPALNGFAIDAYVGPLTAAYGNMSWHTVCRPTVTQSYTITITVANGAGTGAIWTEGGCGIWIKDIGLAIAAAP